jgi:hypothetical protein
VSHRKPPESRQRRNRPHLTLLPTPEPESPVPVLPLDRCWRDDTIRWWLAVWESPVAAMWGPVDVPAVEQLAHLLDRWFGEVEDGGDSSGRLSAEIRQRQDQLGLTPAARARLGWELPVMSDTIVPAIPNTYTGADGIVKPLPPTAIAASRFPKPNGPDDPRAALGASS